MFCERKPGWSVVLTSSKEAHCPDDPHERPKGVPQICPCVFQPNVHISLLHTSSIQHQPSVQECCSTSNFAHLESTLWSARSQNECSLEFAAPRFPPFTIGRASLELARHDVLPQQQ